MQDHQDESGETPPSSARATPRRTDSRASVQSSVATPKARCGAKAKAAKASPASVPSPPETQSGSRKAPSASLPETPPPKTMRMDESQMTPTPNKPAHADQGRRRDLANLLRMQSSGVAESRESLDSVPELCAAAAKLSLKPHSDEAIAIEDSDAEDTCIRTVDGETGAVKIYLQALEAEVKRRKSLCSSVR